MAVVGSHCILGKNHLRLGAIFSFLRIFFLTSYPLLLVQCPLGLYGHALVVPIAGVPGRITRDTWRLDGTGRGRGRYRLSFVPERDTALF